MSDGDGDRFSWIARDPFLSILKTHFLADGDCSQDVILGSGQWQFRGPQTAQGGLQQVAFDRLCRCSTRTPRAANFLGDNDWCMPFRCSCGHPHRT